MAIQISEEFDLELHRECGGDTSWVGGYLHGAAAAFAIIGMAEAIASFVDAHDFWLSHWQCIRCDRANTDMKAVWCAHCAPKRHAREVTEGYPRGRGDWREDR